MNRWTRSAYVFIGLSFFYTSPFAIAHSQTTKTPKLILQLTIDQFSGNQLDRFKQHLNDGGFAYLIQHSIWFDNAHQHHATTQTAVGHTTLATGTTPSKHGIIANSWWDKKNLKPVYAFYDESALILGDTSKEARAYGRSPKNMRVKSFSDALSQATDGKSKRFAVSTKDRGAIPLAGFQGKAFWFDARDGRFVTSSYYYSHSPAWVNSWNKQNLSHQYIDKQWTLSEPCNSYLFCNDGLKHLKARLSDFSSTFPHPYGNVLGKRYFYLLTQSPASDELTLSFSKTLINEEHLGQNYQTDYLAISLSATDAIGHTFGPYSLESEDNFVRLNQELGKFFSFLDTQIGLQNILIVVSADHGILPSATYLSQYNIQATEFSLDEISTHPPVKALLAKYALDWSTLIIGGSPDLYLNDAYLTNNNIDKAPFVNLLSTAIASFTGIAYALPTSKINDALKTNPQLQQLLVNQIYQARSGDIYLIPKPFKAIDNTPYTSAHHGSPWRYDTHVPILFSHPSYTKQRIHLEAKTIDIAPTLAFLLKIDPPIATNGKVLKEITLGNDK